MPRIPTIIALGLPFVLCQAPAAVCTAAGAETGTAVSPPTYRVEAEGFAASEADIRAVLDSAGRELWQFFPDYPVEPIAVARGHSGPITLFHRNDRGEIVMLLDTEKTYWAQYAYQFAHEFCHVLCGFRDGYRGNQWFEETLCETASLYVMRSMSRSWRTSAPYAHWKDFRDALRDYADDIVRKRDKLDEIYAKGLPEFYLVHQAELQENPVNWQLDGAMAVVLLHLFEEQPDRWEAIRWLNHTLAQEGDTLAIYLQHWHDAVPARHRPFIERIAELYGVTIEAVSSVSLDHRKLERPRARQTRNRS